MDREIQSSANSSEASAARILQNRHWSACPARTLLWKCYLSVPRSSAEMMSTPSNTRRWPRHQVVLPVRIVALNRHLTPPTLARGSEISRAGMALHARIAVRPGDLMQLQVPTSPPIDITAVVRNRTGDCLGLEFLPQLPFVNEGREEPKLRRSSAPGARQNYGKLCAPHATHRLSTQLYVESSRS